MTHVKPVHLHDETSVVRRRSLQVLWLLLGLAVLRLAAAALIPLMENTESRYAEIARKMVETNDWITPQYDYGIPFWGKPPLSTWLSAIGIEFLGPHELGPRILILVLSIYVVYLFWRFVRETLGEETAHLAAVLMASCAVYFISAAAVMTDMTLAFSLLVMMTSFWRFTRYWKPRDGCLMFAGIGVGLLSKGPLILVLGGVPIVAWLFWSRQWKTVLSRLPWLWGILIFCVIALPWYIAAEIKTPGFLNYFIVGEHFKRFLVSGWTGDLYGRAHAQPFGMIWLYYLAGLAPWSVVIPLYLWLQRKNPAQAEAGGPGKQELIVFLWCWALTPALFFTPARNVIWTYTLPAIPPAAMLLADAVRRKLPADSVGASLRRIFFMTAAVVPAAVLGFGMFVNFNPMSVTKKTQLPVVQEYKTRCAQTEGCRLWYLGARVYSAEYYTEGRARHVRNFSEMKPRQPQAGRDFFAASEYTVSHLPPEDKDRLVRLQQFGGMILWTVKP